MMTLTKILINKYNIKPTNTYTNISSIESDQYAPSGAHDTIYLTENLYITISKEYVVIFVNHTGHKNVAQITTLTTADPTLLHKIDKAIIDHAEYNKTAKTPI